MSMVSGSTCGLVTTEVTYLRHHLLVVFLVRLDFIVVTMFMQLIDIGATYVVLTLVSHICFNLRENATSSSVLVSACHIPSRSELLSGALRVLQPATDLP